MQKQSLFDHRSAVASAPSRGAQTRGGGGGQGQEYRPSLGVLAQPVLSPTSTGLRGSHLTAPEPGVRFYTQDG
jgi:hypothetical protein